MRKFIIIVPVVFLVLIVALGMFLSRDKTLDKRHEDFESAKFDYANSNFTDYIAYSKQRLRAARVDELEEEKLNNLLPFSLPPPDDCERLPDGRAKQGVLLVHGLLASPYSMKDLADFLQSQCFHVLGLLLPEHGSRPGDFLSANWHDWAEATHFATNELAKVAKQVVLAGHSAGGTLAIMEAEQNAQVSSLLLFAPALQITSAAKYARFIVPLGHLFPKAAWFEVRDDEALYRYESVTFSAAAETWALLTTTLAEENNRIQQLPVFTVVSMQDNTVDPQATLDFMQRNRNEKSMTVLYSQHPYPGSEKITVVASSAAEQGVLSVSHLGLMTSPEHDYYGRDGQYRSCGHYGTAQNPDFQRCKNGERSYYGEVTGENLAQGNIERIAFNPYYEGMLAEMLGFLKQ